MADLKPQDVRGAGVELCYLPSLRTGRGRDAPMEPGRGDSRWCTMAAKLLQPTFLAFPVTAMAAPTPYSTGSAPCESSDTD